jgi:hypothetical protein
MPIVFIHARQLHLILFEVENDDLHRQVDHLPLWVILPSLKMRSIERRRHLRLTVKEAAR